MSRTYSRLGHATIVATRTASRLRTPCGLPMKSGPTRLLRQKSMSLSGSLLREDRGSAVRLTCIPCSLALWSFFQRRECFWQRLCFLASCPSWPTPLPFEAADAAPGHDEGFAGSCGDGRRVDFPEIDRRLHRAGSHFCLRYLDPSRVTQSSSSRRACRPRRPWEGQATSRETGCLCSQAATTRPFSRWTAARVEPFLALGIRA